MSDRTAELVERAREKYDSAEEAWESLKEESVDWDIEKVKP